MQIKSIILNQFKGVSRAEYEFTKNTIVSGRNASGKTTIADAYYWLFTDKDYSLKANPEVHPDFLSESEPSVEIICDIDSKEVSLRKFQKDNRTKKQKESNAPVKISNQYEINAVPVSQKDFVAKLKEYGIDTDNFLLLTHPEIFTGMKSADCRKILFGMVTDVSDKTIAESMGDCQELSDLLDNYTVDEITALQKRTKKEADQNLDCIPEQIVGMERIRVQIDVKALTEQKDTIQTDINNAEARLKNNPLPSVGDLNQQIVALENRQKTMSENANIDRRQKLLEKQMELNNVSREKIELEREIKIAIGAEEERQGRVESLQETYQQLSDTFQRLKQQTFDESTNICKYCGQPLPADRAEENRKRFETEIQRQKDEINHNAARIKKQIKDLEGHPVEIPDGKQLEVMTEHISALEQEITALDKHIDVSDSPEYKALDNQIKAIHVQIDELDKARTEHIRMDQEIAEKRRELNAVNDQLAQVEVNKRIDNQIAEAKQKQKEYAQSAANAEKILDQISRVSMKKNEMLTDQVNSHFSRVRFKLFETLKNGEVRDCCIPMVDTGNGEYRDILYAANTAAIVRGQLDIISGLQKFYSQDLPVFLDGAECLDQNNSVIDVPYQLIQLKVSDDAELVIR